jgi:thioredoxin-like negative regulator of GroEL
MSHFPSQAPPRTLSALSQFDFHTRIAETTGVALTVFTSVDCGACRHLRQVLPAVLRLRPEWQVFEIDAQREAGLTNEFEVFHLPSVFVFYDGQYHCPLGAESRPSAIIDAVHTALQRPAQEAP